MMTTLVPFILIIIISIKMCTFLMIRIFLSVITIMLFIGGLGTIIGYAVDSGQYAIDLQQLLIGSIIIWSLFGLSLTFWLVIEISRVKCVGFYRKFHIENDPFHPQYNV